jgi:hypothetical protein
MSAAAKVRGAPDQGVPPQFGSKPRPGKTQLPPARAGDGECR